MDWADVGAFFAAMGLGWVALMAGAVGVSVGLWERIRGRQLRSTAFIAVSVFAILGACFMAWKTEHDALLQERGSRQIHLRPTFGWVGSAPILTRIGDRPTAKTVVVIAMKLRNEGPLPTIADGWTLRLQTRFGEFAQMKAISLGVPVELPMGFMLKPIVVTEAESLSAKTYTSPIPAGGAVVGYLTFLCDLPPDHVSDPGTTVSLSCWDARLYEHRFTISLQGTNRTRWGGEIGYIPGLTGTALK